MAGRDVSSLPPASSTLTPQSPYGPSAPAFVAFYLPQYHTITENDEWWGHGFTDWANVTAARPSYPGHPVPYVPSELGTYDLTSRDVRARQAELARAHGVYGFCYYFYWFGGRRLLEKPLELMLADGEPSVPFCLCWANEPWTRRWDGRESDILMPQHHDRVGDLAILDDLMPFFRDERYIRIDQRPLLLIYRQSLLDEPARFASDLREAAVQRGLPGLFLCNVLSIGDTELVAKGFDAAVEFPPNGTLGKEIRPRDLGADPAFRGKIYDYASVVQTMLARPILPFAHFPGVMPRWDNTARRGMAAHVFHGSSPELFESWLRRAVNTTTQARHAPLVFVNSWNEWAEGAHLEPDQRAGRGHLEAIRRVVTAHAGDEADRTVQVVSDGTSVPTSDGGLPREERDDGIAVVAPLAGMPTMGEATRLLVSDGVGWIDSVDGRPLHGHVISVAHGDLVLLRGWFYGNARDARRRREPGYLTFSADGTPWHAAISERYPRPDLLRGILARGPLRRRMIRAIDRLPPGVGKRVMRVWSRGFDLYGFAICLRLEGLPSGAYGIGFVDVTSVGSHLVDTEFVVHVR